MMIFKQKRMKIFCSLSLPATYMNIYYKYSDSISLLFVGLFTLINAVALLVTILLLFFPLPIVQQLIEVILLITKKIAVAQVITLYFIVVQRNTTNWI